MAKHFTLITLAFCASAILSGSQLASAEEGKPAEVMDPNLFSDPTQILIKKGYTAAKTIPDVCAKLFCYCGCDITDKHSSLLDCFTSDHGVGCPICIEEALIALAMHNKGKDICEIQYAVDRRYAKQYPFDSPSENLKKYNSERLWDADKRQPRNQSSSQSKGNRKTPELKKNKKSGNCCGGSDEHSSSKVEGKKESK